MTVELSRSARLYQERRLPQDQETLRGPGPRSDLNRTMVHSLPMKAPFPTAEALQTENNHPPDAGHTQPWPRGMEEIGTV